MLRVKTDDVDATFAHLEALGMAGAPPKSFTRPVDLGEERREASFSTVTVRPGVFPAGRVYFCQHHTPDLVWRDAWRSHANGAFATEEFLVVSRDPAAEAARYGQLLELDVAATATPSLESFSEDEPDLANFIFSNVDLEGGKEKNVLAGKLLAQVARALLVR